MEKPGHKEDSWRQEKEIRDLGVFFQTWNSLESKQRGQVKAEELAQSKQPPIVGRLHLTNLPVAHCTKAPSPG